MTTDLKQWAAVENSIVVHGGFDAPQSYIDDYVDQIVDHPDRVTPPWYHEGIEFVDVTGLDPRPTTGWYKTPDGTWVNGNPLLEVNRPTIPADGATAATVTFTQKSPAAPTSVTFEVNGQEVEENLVNGVATLEVTSTNAGDVIVVVAGEQTVTITVES